MEMKGMGEKSWKKKNKSKIPFGYSPIPQSNIGKPTVFPYLRGPKTSRTFPNGKGN